MTKERAAKSKKVNGWRSGPNKFSEKTLTLIKSRLPEYREQIISKLPRNAEAGDRFNTDDRVILRICSAFTEDEFLLYPKENIMDALEECAESDYYYNKDKEWEENQ